MSHVSAVGKLHKAPQKPLTALLVNPAINATLPRKRYVSNARKKPTVSPKAHLRHMTRPFANPVLKSTRTKPVLAANAIVNSFRPKVVRCVKSAMI